MPDWSYQTLFRPLLFRLPARLARQLTLSAFGAVGRMPGGAFVIQTLGHQEPHALLETGWSKAPVGLAGSVDPQGVARRGLSRLGFGFMEIGPVTVDPVCSDLPIELDVEREIIRYPHAYENDGVEEIAKRVAQPGHRLPQYVRIAPMPGASADEALEQLVRLAKTLAAAGAAGFYVDLAEDRRTADFYTDPAEDRRVPERSRLLNAFAERMNAGRELFRKPLFLHVRPDEPVELFATMMTELDLDAWSGLVIGGAAKSEGAGAAVRSPEAAAKVERSDGTARTAVRSPGTATMKLAAEAAAEGALARDGALRLLAVARKAARPGWIVKVGAGVHEPHDAPAFLRAGADAVLIGSGFVFARPGLPKRINDAVLSDRMSALPTPADQPFWRNWGWMCLLGIGMIVGGLAAWFVAGTSVLLPYDEHFLGVSGTELRDHNGHLLHFMSHDRITLAGTMISIGVLYFQLAKHGLRYGFHWAKTAVTVSCLVGFPSFFLYLGYGFFDPLHAAAAFVLLPMFLLSLRRNPDRPDVEAPVSLHNDRLWRRAMWGQLCFVALGASLAVGGLVIAGIGVTRVFVPSDLVYLQSSAAELSAFNARLLPLIAHDRAGFGGALFADAIVLLIISLWGIQIGRSWIWRTLLVGGGPAFFAGLGVHFEIGYTDFLHLLPAWFAFALYVAGLFLLYPYMHVRR